MVEVAKQWISFGRSDRDEIKMFSTEAVTRVYCFACAMRSKGGGAEGSRQTALTLACPGGRGEGRARQFLPVFGGELQFNLLQVHRLEGCTGPSGDRWGAPEGPRSERFGEATVRLTEVSLGEVGVTQGSRGWGRSC